MTYTQRTGVINPRPLHRASLVLGSETLVLSHDDIFLSLDYVPSAAPLRVERTPARTADGDVVTNITRGNVSEVLPLLIGSPNGVYANDGIIQQIETMLLKQERRNRTRQGDQLYLTYRPSAGVRHRTPVYAGSLDHTRGTMRGRGASRHQSTLTLEHAPWWEAMEEVELPVSNRHGLDVTGGLQIDNDSDGYSADNFVQIEGVDVLGNYPAPVRIALSNSNLVAVSWRNIYAGRFAYPGSGYTVGQFQHYIQGESATSGGSTVWGGIASSNSNFRRFTVPVPTLVAPITRLGYWTLTATQANALAGGLVQVMVRFATAPDTTKTPRLQWWLESNTAANVPMMKTPDVALSGRQLEAMGTLAIPPGLPGLAGDTAHLLSLWGYAETVTTVDVDFIQLIPTEGFRYYQQSVGDLNADGTFGDTGERVWISTAAGVQFQRTVPTGAPITLAPGLTQRLYFLFDEANDVMDINRTLLAQVLYRPRILTLGQA